MSFGEEMGKAPADLSGKNPWVKDIDEALAKELSERADEVVRAVTAEN